MSEPLIRSVGNRTPKLHPESWVAPSAIVVGDVTLEERASVWYGATLRSEFEPVVVGAGSNIQDGVAVHTDAGFPVTVGEGVSVGHNAVLHGCAIGDGALIGMAAVVLNGAVIGAGSLVAASALVPQGMVVPPRSLVAGVPAKVRRELSDEEVAANRHNSLAYEHLLAMHRDTADS